MSNPSVKPQDRRQPAGKGYEPRDANAKWLFGIVAFLLIVGLLMHFCIAGMMERLQKKPTPTDAWTGLRRAAESVTDTKAVPHLQLAPAEDLNQFRARQETELSSYGWIDRTAGVVRIPVDRAMELALQRNLFPSSGTNESQLGPSEYQLQRERPDYPQPETQVVK